MDKHLDPDAYALFVARLDHRPLLAAPSDAATGSRVGGRPPAPLAAAPPRCPVCGGPLLYVLTLAGDTLGEDVARGRALSLLTCRNFGCRQTGHALVYPSPIVLVAHADAPRATTASELDTPCEGRGLTAGQLARDPVEDGVVRIDASKIGGRPGYIQSWGDEEAAVARERGGDFLFQWSENTLTLAHVAVGDAPFAYGAVYVQSRVDPATKLPVLEDLAGFWQTS